MQGEAGYMNKPILVARADMVQDLITIINQSGVPMSMVEPVLEKLLGEVRAILQQQYIKEKEEYENSLKKDDADNES